MELDELKASWQDVDRRVEGRILRKLLTETLFREAAEAAFAAAVPYQYNGFKIALGQDTLVRVLNELVHPGAGSSAPGAGSSAPGAGELP